MSLSPGTVFSLCNQSLLRVAACLVPRRLRSEWWKEWRAELWHVRQERSAERPVCWHAEQEIAAFCMGAFQDALFLRQQSMPAPVPLSRRFASPMQCVVLLGCLGAALYGAAKLLPGVQTALEPSRAPAPRGLMLISASSLSADVPTITAEQFRMWQVRRKSLFSDFAFYQPVHRAVSVTPQQTATWTVALASRNLIDLLELPQSSHDNGVPQLILSSRAWKQGFAEDPRAVGRVLQVDGRDVQVAAIVPDAQWNLPGNVDAWLLLPDAAGSAVPDTAKGFVVARIDPDAAHIPMTSQWSMTAPTPTGDSRDFTCISVSSRASDPFHLFLFVMILACLALPATTSLPLGEYPDAHHRLARSTRLRRWVFLAAKFALLAPIVYFGSLDLAHLSASMHPATSQYIQMVSSFCICLFALRWTLRDQRRRCPVCLGKLSNPARVGHPSRNFLAWSGTELICVGGHGLLHVPEIPTSWFGTQRWLYLDPSWEVLFPDAPLASPTSL